MVRQAVYERYKDDTSTRAASAFTRRCPRATRKPHTRRCAAACRNTTAATAIAARKVTQSSRRRHSMTRCSKKRCRMSPTVMTCSRLSSPSASPKLVKAYRRGGETVEINEGLRFAARMLGDKVNANQRIRRGAIIRVQKDDKGRWHISQLPAVESALISVDPRDGAMRALVGGFDFNRNQFNHVTQALRSPARASSLSSIRRRSRRALPPPPSSTMRRSPSRPRRPAPSRGSRRITTASSRGRCGCATR